MSETPHTDRLAVLIQQYSLIISEQALQIAELEAERRRLIQVMRANGWTARAISVEAAITPAVVDAALAALSEPSGQEPA